MQQELKLAVLLTVFTPFLAALFAPVLYRVAGRATGWLLALVPLAICAVFAIALPEIARGETMAVHFPADSKLGVGLNFFVDGLSATFVLLISGIGALILIYSGAYLKNHPHLGRFYAFLLAFTGSMLGLVLADSTMLLVTFWELTAVTSFLLIGFEHTLQSARRAALQALIITGIGGLALFLAMVILLISSNGWNLSDIRDNGNFVTERVFHLAFALVLIAAFTKSAQFPFHFWLPNAMEAPTPVSAFLHSATMVQGGVYLLARLGPTFSGPPLWNYTLIFFGSLTLLWGAVMALRQTDLKQMLAQTTIAALGLMVLLLGIDTPLAIGAMMAFLVAHALYKAALFLLVGVIEHETGLRDITALGGLRDRMAISFIGVTLAAIAMIGLPPALGFFAKEEIYGALTWFDLVPPLIVVIANGIFGGLALLMLIKPFMGALLPMPKEPHEGPFAMLLGPLLLGILGIAAGVLVSQFDAAVVAPSVTAISAQPAAPHMVFSFNPLSPPFLLSVISWTIAGLTFWQADRLRSLLRRAEMVVSFTFDKGFDAAMLAMLRLATLVTRLFHHGQLQLYLLMLFVMLALASFAPYLFYGGLRVAFPDKAPDIYEWAVIVLALIGIHVVWLARSRLVAVLALGVQGLAIALIFLRFGAPDLAFTQLLVEVLTVVIIALVMTRLSLEKRDPRKPLVLVRDIVVALACGLGVMLLLVSVLSWPFPDELPQFFAGNSAAAHGRNIVNVILVDFRALDTLGEISVLMAAGIAVLALLRRKRRVHEEAPVPKPARQRRKPA